MRIQEILTELTFQGSPCTKDCSGHKAGYGWQNARKGTAPCASVSPSFNKGCQIAKTQIQNNKVVRPKVRDNRGRFASTRPKITPTPPTPPTTI